MLTATLNEQMHAIVEELPEIALVYLFGSQVTGQTGPLSDIDLAILLTPEADGPSVRTSFAHAAAVALETDRIDVILLNQAPIELAYAIIAEGELLFRRDTATLVEYEALVLSKYGDYLPVLRAQRRDILQGSDYATRVHRYQQTFRRTERTLSALAAPANQNA